jgi:WD40 repeat protein/energy-coupling factor transporter ATP-binding protein EcfA2
MTTVDWRAYDVFLSHNSRDKPAVARIDTHLRSLGLRPWLDDRALQDEWHGAMQAAIDEVAACVVCIGPNGWGRWQFREAQLADSRHIEDPAFRLIPVLLPGLEDESLRALPRWLGQYRFVDLRAGLDDPDRLQELRNRIVGISGDAASPDADLDEVVCPYRGLEAFGAEHAQFFYGRDSDIEHLLSKIQHNRFLAVLGASGSGKSSVVLAGLLPRLQAGALPGSENWKVQVLRPGVDPLKALADAATLLSAHQSVNKTLDELASDPRTLDGVSGLILAQDRSAQRVVWVVDQAEELFTQCSDVAKRAQFLANLVHVSTVEGGRAMVVLTMRADFYANCAEYRDFARLLESNQYLVGPLDEAGLRRAIVQPAGDLGRTFETGLVETILDDVRQQPGGLPLLQYALRELWQRQVGRVLTLRGYRDAGGVAGALAKRADAVYQGLTGEEQRVARTTLLQLTQPQEGMDATRRRATLRQLVPSETMRPVVEQVVQQLVAARLLTTDRQANDEWVDVAHESLIRNWETLHQWVEEDREGLRLLHKLQDASEEWRGRGQTDDELWGGARLAQALEWQPQHEDMLSDDVRAFIDASVAKRDHRERAERAQVEQRLRDARDISRANRFLRLWLAVAVIIGIVAVSATVFALQQKSTADVNALQADQQRQGRVTELLAAEALDRLDQRDLSLLLSVEASRRLGGDSAEVKRSLLSALTQTDGLSRFLYGPMDSRTDWVGSLAFSPDGTLLVSGADSGAVMFWDTAAGTLMGTPVVGHSGRVSSVTFSPDGQTLASASEDHTVRLWDVSRRQPRGEPMQGHTSAVRSVAFSPDGTRLASSGDDATIRLWDVATGQPDGSPIRGHVGSVRSVAFSPDGTLLASGGNDGTIRLWDPTTGQAHGQPLGGTTISTLNNEVASLAFSPNPADALLAAGNWNGTVALWNVRTGEAQGPPKKISDLPVESVAFGSTGSLLVTGNSDKTIALWNVKGTTEPRSLTGQGASVTSVAISPTAQMVASAGQDGSIVLWNRPDDQPLYRRVANKHTLPVGSLTFVPNTTSLVSATKGGTITTWDVATQKSRGSPPTGRFPTPLLSVAVNPSGTLAAMESSEGVLTISDVGKHQVVARLDVGEYMPLNLAFSPKGGLLGSVGCATSTCETGEIRTWDVSDWKTHRQPISVPSQAIRLLAFSPDERVLATIGGPGSLALWDVDSSTAKGDPVVVSSSTVNTLAFASDGRVLAAGDTAGSVNIFDVATRQVRQMPPADASSWVSALAYSPDGRWLAWGGLFGTVGVWDLSAPQAPPTHVTGDDGAQVLTLAFSADGRTLASGGQNGFIFLWDTTTGQAIGDALLEGGAGVSSLAYSSDGQQLAVSTTGGMLEVWDPVSASLTSMAHILGTLVNHAAFTPQPNGRLLVVSSDAGLGFWDVSNAVWPTWQTANPKGGGLAFEHSGQTLAVGGCSQWKTSTECSEGGIQLWDVASQKPRGDLLVAGPIAIESVAISSDGARVAGGAPDGTVFVWDTSTGQLVGSPLKGHTVDVTALAFSPDGSILASGSRDTNIVLWNPATGQAIGQPLRGHSNSVFTLAFSSDGRVLASGSADATVRLWDVASGAPIGTLDNGAWVTSVVFKPDDPSVLVSAGLDGAVWQWDVSLATWQQRACVIAGRDLTEQEWHRYVGDEPYRSTCSTLVGGR